MTKKLKNTAYFFVLSSALIHMFLYGGLDLLSHFYQSKNPPKPKSVEVTILDSSPQKSQQNTRQVVEQDKKQLNDEIPKDAKFLGRHNQRVVEQTKAAATGKFKHMGKLPSLKQLRPGFSFTAKSQHQQSQMVGQESQSPDHLKDVKTGIQTLLSTREFVYYAYYQRIRTKIRHHWEPLIRDKVRKVFKSGRSIASARDRITQVIIILNPQGSLINVQILGESGVKDLDDAAIEAFRAAEPFPNPPKGIVEGDGTIKIRWDFVLEARLQPIKQQPQMAQVSE